MPPRSKVVTTLPAHIRGEVERRILEKGFSDYKGLAGWVRQLGIRPFDAPQAAAAVEPAPESGSSSESNPTTRAACQLSLMLKNEDPPRVVNNDAT